MFDLGSIREMHRRFGELLPETLLMAENPTTGERNLMTPGALRQRGVRVGQHLPVSPGAVGRCLKRFAAAYAGLGKAESIVHFPAPHEKAPSG